MQISWWKWFEIVTPSSPTGPYQGPKHDAFTNCASVGFLPIALRVTRCASDFCGPQHARGHLFLLGFSGFVWCGLPILITPNVWRPRDCTSKKGLCVWACPQLQNLYRTRTLAENGDEIRIAPKVADVFLHPSQRHDVVVHPQVQRNACQIREP